MEFVSSRVDHGIMAKNKKKLSQKKKDYKQVKNSAKSEELHLLIKGMIGSVFSHGNVISYFQSSDDYLGVIK